MDFLSIMKNWNVKQCLWVENSAFCFLEVLWKVDLECTIRFIAFPLQAVSLQPE